MPGRQLVLVFLALAATPAQASGFSIPEPSTITLLGLGLAGLIIGRFAARQRPDE